MTMLGYMTPLLGESNRFFVMGGGTGDPSLFHGCRRITPLFSDINNISHRGDGVLDLEASPEVLQLLDRENITHVIYSLPELWGQQPPPFHSKPRYRLKQLLPCVDETALHKPLANEIERRAPADVERLVEERLRAAGLGAGKRLCVLSAYGVTHRPKDWPAIEARKFAEQLRRHDPNWLIVSLETGRKHGVGAAAVPSNAILDGIAFGVGLRALYKFADLFVGVPSGPYCVSCLYDFPTVAIWQSLWPSWYMEPKETGVNIIGQGVLAAGHDRTPGSITAIGGVRYPISRVGTITADEVLAHVRPWI